MTAQANMPEMPFTASARAYLQSGWSPIPLPYNEKTPPPDGFTGTNGADASMADIQSWIDDGYQAGRATIRAGNVALRLPKNIIGVDVDMYMKGEIQKLGKISLARLETKYGRLPPTWTTTARDDGSGIRLFSTPEGLDWPGAPEHGIEIIQHRHRYAVVWPSVNPLTGTIYRWKDGHGNSSIAIPSADDIVPIPDGWIEGLTGGRSEKIIGRSDLDGTAALDWMARHGGNDAPCPAVERRLQLSLASLHAAGHGGRHDAATGATQALAHLAAEGHLGIQVALNLLHVGFVEITTGEDRSGEWPRMIVGAIQVADARKINALGDPCRDVFSSYGPTQAPFVNHSGFTVNPFGEPIAPTSELDDQEAKNAIIEFKAQEQEIFLRARDIAQRRIRGEHRLDPKPSIGLKDLLAESNELTEFRITDLLPAGGRVVLSAQRKTGKTTFVTNLVRCLADGGMFLDRFPMHRTTGRIVLLDFEMVREQLANWLRRQEINQLDRISVQTMRGSASSFDIMDDKCRSEWAGKLKDDDCGFLIIDCLRPIMDSIGLDESHDAGRFLVALDALLLEAGVKECVLVHHAGHNGERARGDSRLRDWPDVEWRLMREKPEREGEESAPNGPRFFVAEGREVSILESRLTFDPHSQHLGLEGGSRADDRKVRSENVILSQIIQVLTESENPLSQNAISASVVGKDVAIKAALKSAVDRRLIAVNPGPGRSLLYTLRSGQ